MNTVTYEDIKKANETIATTTIEKVNKKTGEVSKKEYAEVNQRIKAFRMVYPDGFICTSMMSNADGVCVFRAEVGYYNENGSRVVIGSGTAYEKEDSSFINSTSYIENCETSAAGRALGMAGFGIDTSVASLEEVKNAMANQKEEPKAAAPVADKPVRKASPKQIEVISRLYTGDNMAALLHFNGINRIEDLPMTVASSIISKIERKSNK